MVGVSGDTITACASSAAPRNLAPMKKTMGHRDVRTAIKYQYPQLEIVRAALKQADL